MDDFFIVIIWFVIMGVVAVAKMVKRKGDAQDPQEQQDERRPLAQQQQQQQQGDREQRHRLEKQHQLEEQHQQDPYEQMQRQEQLHQRVERQEGQQREPVSQDGKHAAARKLIEDAIERQSSAARKHAETQMEPHPGDQKIPLVTRSTAPPKPSVAAVGRKGQLRRALSSKRDIRNAIILREVLDRPRAYDV